MRWFLPIGRRTIARQPRALGPLQEPDLKGRAKVRGAWIAVYFSLACGGHAPLAQRPVTASVPHAEPPRTWAEAGVANQENILKEGYGIPLRYRLHKSDAHGSSTREVSESREGTVSRTLEREGRPLTAEEDRAERDRLNGILADPDAFARHRRHEGAGRSYALQLIQAMPAAMLWTCPRSTAVAPGSWPASGAGFHSGPEFPSSKSRHGGTERFGRPGVDRRA